ncbi:MAG: glycosyltransferase [Ktedonobacteraceae bacterium]
MQDMYHSLGAAKICVCFVFVYKNAFIVLAPPSFSSSLYIKEKHILTHHPLPLADAIIGDQFWQPLRCFPVLTVFHNGKWNIWGRKGLLSSSYTTWHELATGTIEATPVEGWSKDFSIEEGLAALGFPLTMSSSLSIQECLLQRSNDYWAIEKLFNSLTGLDLVWGDASQLNWEESCGSLSIVIPCYNANTTIYTVLDSVYAASKLLPKGVNCEVIVVDDKSNDPVNSDQIPLNVRTVHALQQLFCGGARNVGLMLAAGDIVLFLDADTTIAPNYLVNHWLRHQIFPGLILVSMREYLQEGMIPPARMPVLHQDSRWEATYTAAWKGLVSVHQEITVHPLADSQNFRSFGNGRAIGPTDLPFMVKGNNFSVARLASLAVRFPPHFDGWGPEDVCFGAKLIARGHFVVPVLSTGAFHINHLPRSGSEWQKQQELETNLQRYAHSLRSSPFEDWDALV